MKNLFSNKFVQFALVAGATYFIAKKMNKCSCEQAVVESAPEAVAEEVAS